MKPELNFNVFEAIWAQAGDIYRQQLLSAGLNPDDIEPLAREFENEIIDHLREKFAITPPSTF